MKKFIVILVLTLTCAAGAFAQSLQNNEYYQKSVEFSRLSEQALAAGDFDAARDYAMKAQENAALSKNYIDAMVLAYRARTALNAARARIGLADRYNLKARDLELYNSAAAFYRQANSKFEAKDYENSLIDSQKVIDLLRDFDSLAGTGTSKGNFAAQYIVKLNPALRDCLWRIAGFDFVYGDSLKWKFLYDANKDSFPNPSNPGLIVPGQVLKIPSISGEARSGQR
jgi:tetratricopeptide (TPR) repeat protein